MDRVAERWLLKAPSDSARDVADALELGDLVTGDDVRHRLLIRRIRATRAASASHHRAHQDTELLELVEGLILRSEIARAHEIAELALEVAETSGGVALAHVALSSVCAARNLVDQAVRHLELAMAEIPAIPLANERARRSAALAGAAMRVVLPDQLRQRLTRTALDGSGHSIRTTHDEATFRALAWAARLGTPKTGGEPVDALARLSALPPVRLPEDLLDPRVLEVLLDEYLFVQQNEDDDLGLDWAVVVDDRLSALRRLELPPTRDPVVLLAHATADITWARARLVVVASEYARRTARMAAAERLVNHPDSEWKRFGGIVAEWALAPGWIAAMFRRENRVDDAIRSLLAGYDRWAKRIPAAFDAELSTEWLWTAYRLAAIGDWGRTTRLRSILERSVPAALRLDARAATSVDLDQRDHFLRLASMTWGVAISLSQKIGDHALTAELIAVHRTSLVMDAGSPSATLAQHGDDAAVATRPVESQQDRELAVAASSALLAAVDRRGFAVRPRPLVVMPDGRIALEAHIAKLDPDERESWFSPYSVPLA